MRGHVKTKIFQWLAKLGFVAAAFLIACSGGGGTAGSGGPGGAGPVGGSSLDTANFAGGPVSISSPDTVSSDSFEIELALISCKNIVPEVLCRGSAGSVPNNSNLRMSVYAPGNAGGTVLGSPVNYNADGVGAWMQSIPGATGQIIGICLIKDNVCTEVLYLTVPPPGQTVNGLQGVMQNLTVDSNGNILFSKNQLPPPEVKRKWSWTSLFISEAHAEEGTPYSGFYFRMSPEIVKILLEQPKEEDESESSGLAVILEPPVTQEAICPNQPVNPPEVRAGSFGKKDGEAARPLVSERNPVRVGSLILYNEASLKRISPASPGAVQMIWTFPGYSRSDIRNIFPYSYGGEDYIAVALDSQVRIIKDGDPINEVAVIDFPKNLIVSKIFDMGGSSLAAVVTARPMGIVAQPAYSVYWVEKNPKAEKLAWCLPVNEAVSHLSRMIRLEGYSNRFVGVGQKANGTYSVIAGSPYLRTDMDLGQDFLPVELVSSDHPLDAVLIHAGTWDFTVAVLSAEGKWIRFIHYNNATTPPTTSVVQWNLEERIRDGVNYPHQLQFTPNGSRGELAFIDMSTTGSRIIGLNYTLRDGLPLDIYSPTTIYPIGATAPSFLARAQGSWIYNTSEGSIKKAQSQQSRLGLDSTDLGTSGEFIERESDSDVFKPLPLRTDTDSEK